MKRIYFKVMLFSSVLASCESSDTPGPASASNLPILVTASVTHITTKSADSGGSITSDGGSPVTARGVCWGLTENPTTEDNKTTDGNGTGVFASTLLNLEANTKYYVRAYATNNFGTSYGDIKTFTTASPWSTAKLSVPRHSLAAAAVGSKILFAGGTDHLGVYYDVVDIYDVNTGIWSVAKLSQARSNLVAISVGSKVMFAGGYFPDEESSVVDIYDDISGEWSTADLSMPRHSLAATANGSKAFFGGGYGTGYYPETNIVDIYDVDTDTWTATTFTQLRISLAAASLGSKVYFAGGYAGYYSVPVIEIYDMSNETWADPYPSLSEGRSHLAACTVGTKVLFAGGMTRVYHYPDQDGVNVVDIFDGSLNQWTTTTISEARYDLGVASTGEIAFFAGGAITSNGYFSKTVDIYNDVTGQWTVSTLSEARQGAAGVALGSKIFFAGGYGEHNTSDVVDIYDLEK